MTRARNFAASLLLLAGALHAQRVLIVDQAGGPGVFTDLPPAVAAANDGDTIVIRRIQTQPYSGAVTGKALRLLGEGAAWVTSLGITGLASGKETVVKELRVDNLTLQNNGGRVVLHRLQLLSTAFSQCRAVGVNECTMTDFTCASSTVSIGWSTIVSITPTLPAMTVTGSQVQIAGSWIEGYAYFQPVSAPTEGIRESGSVLALAASTEVHAGTGPIPMPAIRANGSLTIDPSVRLVPNAGAPPVVGGTVVQQAVAALFAMDGGGTVVVGVFGPANALAVTLVSPVADPGPTSFGPLWLDATATVVDVASLGGGPWRIQLPVPGFVPRGTALVFQSAVLTSGPPALSIPSHLVLR